MPFMRVTRGEHLYNYTRGGDGRPTGKPHGTFPNTEAGKQAADRQLRLLWSTLEKEKTMVTKAAILRAAKAHGVVKAEDMAARRYRFIAHVIDDMQRRGNFKIIDIVARARNSMRSFPPGERAPNHDQIDQLLVKAKAASTPSSAFSYLFEARHALLTAASNIDQDSDF